MPGTRGHEHVAMLRTVAPKLPVIVLSGSEDVALMRALMELGVQGFIPKAYSPDAVSYTHLDVYKRQAPNGSSTPAKLHQFLGAPPPHNLPRANRGAP